MAHLFSLFRIPPARPQLERLIEKNYYLNRSAKDGYRAYLQAYASHSLKNVFNVNELDLQKVGKSFGFTVPPAVNLGTAHKNAHMGSTHGRV